MFVAARLFERLSALFMYAAFISAFGGLALAGGGYLARKAIGPLTLEPNSRPPTRVDIGLAAQDRAAFHQPISFEILMRPPTELPLGTLAKQMDDAEASVATAPPVAAWVIRARSKPTVALEESPGNLVLRSLRAEL